MAIEDRFRVVIGLSVVKDEVPGYNDNGIVYHNMKYPQVLEVESIYAKHAPEIIPALAPLVEDLLKLGYAAIAAGTTNVESVASEEQPGNGPKGVIR